MEKIDAAHYDVAPTDCLFFDTNVWLMVNGPVADSQKRYQSVYSRLLREALSRKACVYISSSVISEYINVVLNIGFKSWLENNHYAPGEKDFKRDYRPTQDYADQLQDAKQQINEILNYKCITRLPDDFNAAPVSSIISVMTNGCDYNDSYYLYLCSSRNAKLVSNDSDFIKQRSTIKLITALRD